MKGRLSAAWKAASGFVSTHRRWAARGAVGVGAAFIVLLVHRSTYGVLVADPHYKPKAIARVQVAPMWGAGESTVEMPADLSLFDDGLVERIGKAFERNPWVKRVTAVERAFPDAIRVRFEARRPHLAVRRADGVTLVDADGVRLPGVYASAPACACPVEVTGVAGAPPAAGTKWLDADVLAGRELAELAARTPALAALGVRSVDVSNVGGRVDRRRPDAALVTAKGCTIWWGRSPSSPGFGEPGAQEKLDMLAGVCREYPNLDGLKYVKLNGGGRAAVGPAETGVGRRTQR